MRTPLGTMGSPAATRARARRRLFDGTILLGIVLLLSTVGARPGIAQERILFPAVEDAHAAILATIRAEQVRLDVATWLLTDREISSAIVAKHRSGVPVRVLGDRAALFEADPNTRTEFEYLASNGVPIRLRFHPTWFPEIMHWKCAIFVGQNLVEFGSANWTSFELKPWSPTNFKDETVMFSDDAALVRAFLTKFDQMWADTTSFLDWHDAYRRQTGRDWTTPMSVSRVRLEPDYATNIPGMVWSQGAELNQTVVAEIDRERSQIDMVIYRLSDPGITDALIRRRVAGVPVRIFIEPLQYRQRDWPEYWLTGARIDQLWVAGVRIRQRTHAGLTHMKTLITSSVALNGSSNFTRNWQRDHNYFISAVAKPSLYFAMRDRFDAMWRDATHYTDFAPQRPEEPQLAGPPSTTGVSTLPRLEWNRARWAVAFDVYLGTSPQALVHQARVNAQLVEDPPATYSWTPGQPLQSHTTYYWQIVSRTFATAVNPSLVAGSTVRSFATGSGTGGTWGSGGSATGTGCVQPPPAAGWVCLDGGWRPPDSPPPPPPPSTGGGDTSTGGSSAGAHDAASSCSTASPGSGWTCVNGGWLPPGHPAAVCGGTPDPFAAQGGGTCVNGGWVPPAPTSQIAPSSGGCATAQPAAGWVCINGGWIPREMLPATSGNTSTTPNVPIGTGGSAPPTNSRCSTPSPGAGWTCVDGGWLPPGHPLASCGGTPDPFAALGGGVCTNGSWVSPSAPAAAPGPVGCTTPDPFTSMDGGVCVNGGWIPRTHPAAGG